MNNLARVGAFVLIALAVCAYLVLRIEHIPLGRRRVVAYVVTLPDAQGLADKSAVLLKGVRVGRVIGLDLDGAGVSAHIQLDRPVSLHEGTSARVSSVGLLGEKQLDLVPGPADKPVLPPGSQIQGRVSPSLDTVIAALAGISSDVQSVTGAVKKTVGGERGEERMAELVERISGVAAQLEQLLANNQQQVKAAVGDVREVTRSLAKLSDELARITSKDGAVGAGMDNARATTESLRKTAEHLEAITARLERGEGTLGRLLVKEDVGDHLDAAIQSVDGTAQGLLGRASQLEQTRLGLGLRADYLAAPGLGKSYLQLDVLPPGRGFLRLELVGEPATSSGATGASGPLTFSALAGFRVLPPLSARAGLLESRPGGGLDLHLFAEQLRLSADLWDLGRADLLPHGRLEAAYRVLPPIHLIAGWDDPLNVGRGADSFFAGAAFRLETGGK